MSDLEARRRAQSEFATPLLLEAGAGTGKTAVLVARAVVWALGPGWEKHAKVGASDDATARAVLSRVVAITFTEAAAAEMATRVASALREIALGQLPTGVFADALPAHLELRAARARALRSALDHLTVRTIHAFCRRLLARHPLEAGLHPQLSVDADQQQAALAAREALEAHLVAAFGAGGDAGAWSELAVARIGPSDVETALIALLSEGARESDLALDALAPEAYAAFGRELEHALDALIAAEGGCFARAKQVDVAQELVVCAAGLRAWLAEGPLTEARLALASGDELAPEKIRDRLRKWAADGLGTIEARVAGAAGAALVSAARRVAPLADRLARLDPPALSAAREVLAQLLATARGRLRERGVATYGALLRDARDLLEIAAVRATVRASIDQLLVDEFQDTDETQCALLAELGFGAEPHPTLFVVGDPKQSIYGWRSADLAAYDAFKGRLTAERGAVARLSVSYRSTRPVLAEIERAIAPIMREREGLQARFEALEVSEQRRGDAPFAHDGRAAVEHWVGFERASAATGKGKSAQAKRRFEAPERRTHCEREARAVADDLVRLQRDGQLAFGEAAILLRATTELPLVLGALREAGVPFVVERETAFHQRREVIDALAWVRCVLDPHDQLALLTTLRSATVGIPDAALVAVLSHCPLGRIARIGEPGALELLREGLALAARETPPGVPGLDALADWPASAARFFEDLAALRVGFATLPADRFVEALRLRSGIEATEARRHLGGHRVATLDRIFRDLAEWADELQGSPSLLLAALRRSGGEAREQEEGRPTSLAEDAVRVLTVHKAKGLDFRHVYLLQLHRSDAGNPEAKPTHVWRRGARREYQLLGLATPGAWRELADASERAAEERIRLLYVAMTRAKDRLVLSWCPDENDDERPKRVSTIGDLLLQRAGRPALAELEAGERTDAHGARWRRIAEAAGAAERVAAGPSHDANAVPDVAREEAELAAARADASRREAMPVQRVASELTHDDEAAASRMLPDDDASQTRGALPDRDRRIALAAGTAVHAALEHADLAASNEALAADGVRAIAHALGALEPADERAAAERRARAIWEHACAGPLLARLRAIAPRVLARELPVLLAPGELAAREDAPVGFVSGAIDLLYEDERGVVVADYKTDDAPSEDALRAKTASYAAQGDVYTRAVQRALGLAERPRFELWFLQTGDVREA